MATGDRHPQKKPQKQPEKKPQKQPEKKPQKQPEKKPQKQPEKKAPQQFQERAPGEVVVGTGRISAARRVTPVLPTLPFTRSQLASIEDELTSATRRTGLHVSVYLGDLGDDTRGRAEELLDSLGDQGARAVLVAVSPGQRVVEVVTGSDARRHLTDRGCKLGVMSMVASFEQGDLAAGLVNGLRMLADQAAQ